ncbi:MAG: hypothetical protein HYV47_02365 [Candidatus Nealsonbacteria bacterium]|nr:hypothetical protein [Candidatus Nealsonbacteria bacterium]
MKKLLFFLIIISAGLGFLINKAEAGTGDNVSGWAWSENIGWINFNGSNYGVTINSNGNFSGYAWSENIGWIDFAPAGPYPASPNYSACLDLPGAGQACDGIGNYNVGGWARVLSYGGGWDGWIKLRGINYGISIDKKTGDFSGYAWSDIVVGWINFQGINYKVKTTFAFNSPPDKPTKVGDGESWNHCSYQGKSITTFSWTYSDPDSDFQSAYEIEVDDNSSFNAPKFNHLVNLAATSYVLDLSQDDNLDWISQLAWNTTYFWRVRVKDNQGNWSDWSSPDSFQTPKHAYPWPDFNFTPLEPTQGEIVAFNSGLSQVYGGAVISSYLWAITQGAGQYVDGTSNISANPHIIFSTPANKIKLAVTDSDGYSCQSSEKPVAAQLPLPEYKEVAPTSWLQKIFFSLTKFWKFATL